jgi:4-amino-4-deoxy-L-arabinose transferase-like glycosyltransferase
MRRDPAVFFLLAWIIPGWLLFELVPTKLPHYVLPLYPAIAIGVALALERGALSLDAVWRKAVFALLPLLAAVVAVVAVALCRRAGAEAVTLAGVAALGAASTALAGLAWVRAGQGRWPTAAPGAVASAALAGGLAWIFVMAGPGFAPYRLSPRLAEAARAAAGPGCVADIATISYREPSLVFLTRTDLHMTNAAGAAAFLRAAPCRVALVEKASETRFLAEFAGDQPPRLASRVVGTNLNGGKTLDIGVYVRQGSP